VLWNQGTLTRLIRMPQTLADWRRLASDRHDWVDGDLLTSARRPSQQARSCHAILYREGSRSALLTQCLPGRLGEPRVG
jgi:hypothetical protein